MTMFVSRLRRSRPSAHSAATRTISSSLAGVSTCRCCAVRERQDHLVRVGRRQGRRTGVRGRPSRHDAAAAHHGSVEDAARRLLFLLARAVLRAARTHDQNSKTPAEAERTAKDYLSSVENSIKVRRMQLSSLLDDRMMDEHAALERKLRDAVAADPVQRPRRAARGTTSPAPRSATARS